MQTIKERYESVNERIANAANKVGRSTSNIHLIAVTKHATVDEVRQLIDLGHSDFGENRLQQGGA